MLKSTKNIKNYKLKLLKRWAIDPLCQWIKNHEKLMGIQWWLMDGI
jgi:hypothetical protein